MIVVARYSILQLLGLDMSQRLELDTIGFPYLDQSFWTPNNQAHGHFEAAEYWYLEHQHGRRKWEIEPEVT